MEIQSIVVAVKQAAELTRRVQTAYLSQINKSGHEPVTIADYGAQAILCRAISQAFPQDAVIAEESAAEFMRSVKDTQRDQIAQLVGETLGETVTCEDLCRWLDHGRNVIAECTWIIDPIDGTRGFLASQPYVIGVGLLESGNPMGAVMGLPTYDGGVGRLLMAWDGKAYRQSFEDDEWTPISVSDRTDTIVAVEDKISSRVYHKVLCFGEAATKMLYAQLEAYALVACGEADLFVAKFNGQCSSKVWDNAAGVALVQAAGGKVTDCDGKSLDFSHGTQLSRNRGILITNDLIHEQVIADLKV